MELKDVLDDIQADLPLAPYPAVAAEEIHPAPEVPVEPDQVFFAENLEALETYKTCVIYSKALASREVLDKSLALEIFTMLPNLDDPLTVAKLTGAASAHNKSLVTKKLSEYQPTSESILPLYHQLNQVLDQVRLTCAEVLPVVQATLQTATAEYLRVKETAVVVFCRKPYDLMQVPLMELVQIDDRLIDYPPYAGVLREAIYKIVESQGYRDTYTSCSYQPSMVDLLGVLQRNQEHLLRIEIHSARLATNLAQYSDETFTQIDFQDLVQQVKTVRRIKHSYLVETAFIDAIISFFKLLT